MNLEELISKYIDGNLSDDEDRSLRLEVSQNPATKELFDDSINIHFAFKEEAQNIYPPDDLVSKTEDLILMKILASQPIIDERPAVGIPLFMRMRHTFTLVSIILLIFVYNISDLSFLINSDNHQLSYLEQNTNKASTVHSVTSVKPSRTGKGITDVKTLSIKNNVELTNQEYHNYSIIESKVKGNESIISISDSSAKSKEIIGTSDINSVDNNKTNIKDKDIARALNLPESPLVPNQYYYVQSNHPDFSQTITEKPVSNNFVRTDKFNLQATMLPVIDYYNDNHEVLFSSFFGTDLLRKGNQASKNNSISHFSQSIAYDLASDVRFGVEIGYSEYMYEQSNQKTIINKTQKSGTKIESLNSDGSEAVLSNYPFTLNQNKQLLWGAAFYEHSLFNSSPFTINGRIGFGACSDGPVGYSKIFGRYEMIHGVSLTLGTDVRLFYARSADLYSDNAQLKGSVSLIYGLQIRF
jgi:hypothetical protein